MKILCILL